MKRKSKAVLSALAATAVALSACPGIIPEAFSVPSTVLVAEAANVSYYKISVARGTLSNGNTKGSAKESQYITVTADEPGEGKKFSYWYDEDTDLIVSYDAVYSFQMPAKNLKLRAKFSEYDYEKHGIATAQGVTADRAAKKVTFTVSLNIPEGCTYVRGGVVATSKNNVRAEVDLSNADFVKESTKGNSDTRNLTYKWTKSGANADTVWFVKGYLVYKDKKGKEWVSYSRCMKGNINGDVSNKNGAVYDKNTGTLSLRGKVSKSDVEAHKYDRNIKKVIAEKGSSITGDVSYLFNNYQCEEVDLSKLDTTGITDMTHMFAYTYGIRKINMHGMDTSQVTSMNWLFTYCYDLEELDMTGWDTSKVEDMEYLFAYNRKLPAIDISSWNLSSVRTMLCMFYECDSITELDLSKSDMPNLEDACLLAAQCDNLETAKFGNSTTAKLDNAASLFYNCPLLKNVDVSTLNTSNVTNVNGMFQSCPSIESIDVSNFDTGNVTDFGAMFRACTNLKSIDVSGFDTSKATKTYDMFCDCSELTSIGVDEFNTSNVTNMSGMFRNCSNLTSLDVSGFNTAKVTNMAYMFSGCTVLPYVDLTGFNYSKVTKYANYSTMFDDSPMLLANVVSAYRTELTNGYMATLKTYITPGDNAATAVVSIGDQSQEFSRDEWNLSSSGSGYISFNFKSNAVPSSEKFKIRFYDAEGRQLPVIGVSNSYCNYGEFTRSSSDVTRTYFRVTTVVGDESSYVEYNSGNKKLVLSKNFVSSSLIPDGYKISGWEINGTFYAIDSEYWTGGRDTTITAVLVEKPVRETIALSLDSPVNVHYEDGDSDTLSFTASEAGTYVFKSEDAYQMTGRLYSNAEMTDIITNEYNNNGAGNFRISVELAEGQTVYMNNYAPKTQEYTVKVRKMSDPPRKTTVLALNGTATGHYEDIEEFDDFSFTAPEDGVYLFTANNEEGGISGSLYSNAGLSEYIAGSGTEYGSFTIRAELTKGQTVYFKPEGYDYYNSCDYTVSVAKKTIVVHEPIALELDKETFGNYTDIDDYDRYSFTAEEAGTYIFKGVSAQGDISGYLYSNAAMTECIGSGYPSWSDEYVYFIIRVDLEAGQTVYLKPEFDFDKNCIFTVTVSKKNVSVTELELDTPTAGHFEDSDNYDVFSFTADEDEIYVFESESNADTFGYLYSDPALSEVLASDDDGGGNSQFRIEYELKAGQTVYLKPVRYYESGSCDYTVTVSKCSSEEREIYD